MLHRSKEPSTGKELAMTSLNEQGVEQELVDLIELAENSQLELMDRYEAVEADYRNATAAGELAIESSTTTGVPASMNVTAASAR
jgi:hypothetical protein